jgi:hypothetical protein
MGRFAENVCSKNAIIYLIIYNIFYVIMSEFFSDSQRDGEARASHEAAMRAERGGVTPEGS